MVSLQAGQLLYKINNEKKGLENNKKLKTHDFAYHEKFSKTGIP